VISICMVAVLAEVNDVRLTDIHRHRRGLAVATALTHASQIICGACALADVQTG